MASLDDMARLRFMLGWPLWTVGSLGLLAIYVIRWRTVYRRSDLVGMGLAGTSALVGLLAWLALLSRVRIGTVGLWASLYTAAVLLNGWSLVLVALSFFVRGIRNHDRDR